MTSQGFHLRAASPADIENLRALIQKSVLGLGSADYSPQQLASALTHLFGVDTRLIEDGTYYVVEAEGRPVACGGWSLRRTLFGGDQYSSRSDDRLDPEAEAARIRAFFVHPDWARRGIARLLLEECARAAQWLPETRAHGDADRTSFLRARGVPRAGAPGARAARRRSIPAGAHDAGSPFTLSRRERAGVRGSEGAEETVASRPALESPIVGLPQYPPSERPVEEKLRDTDDFFAGQGPVHSTLRRLATRLDQEGIPYAIIGAMALNLLGYARQTVDVDVLLSSEGLERFRDCFVGRGYVPAFPGAQKSFRDSDTGVRIDVIRTGEYPGDGKPKPVSFPDPATSAVAAGVYRVVSLEKLIELKIASGLSAPHRQLVDLADVQRLIEELSLPAEVADRLDPSVQLEYRRLWSLAQRRAEGPHERG